MTRHFKLTGGDIVEITSESRRSVAYGIRGTLIGITEGDGKTCFIFRAENGDLLRFYLDYGRRPASRLLILLCNGIRLIRGNAIEIISVKTDIPGQSRLNIRFIGLDDTVEAPYVLPRDYNSRNAERIALILATLEYSEDTDDTAPEEPAAASDAPSAPDVEDASATTMGELRDHAPLVVGGLGSLPQGERGITVRDAREVTLVRNFPLVAVIYPYYGSRGLVTTEQEAVNFVRNYRDIRTVVRTFLTKKERDAFKDGVTAALETGMRAFFVESREHVDSLLEIAGLRFVQESIDENEEY